MIAHKTFAWLDLTSTTFGGNEIIIVNEIHKREKKIMGHGIRTNDLWSVTDGRTDGHWLIVWT